MEHPLNGKWKITAKSPLGDMNMEATMNVNDDCSTFSGSVYDLGSKKTYPLEDGVVKGNSITYTIVMKFGLIPMKFHLEGTFNQDDWTCEGIAKAMKMECSYSGHKVVDEA